METRPLDPADDAQLRRFHEITWRAEKEDGRPWNPMWTFEEMASIFREPTSDRRVAGVAAFDDDRMVGAGWLNLSQLDNLDTAWSFVAVEPELRGRGIGAVVLESLVDLARLDGRTQLLSNAGVPFEERDSSPVIAWAERNGYSVANVEIQRNLDLPVDADLLETMAAEAAEKQGDHEIRTFVGPLPDEMLQSWCDLDNRFVLEAPMGDVDLEVGATTPETLRERDRVSEKIGRTVYTSVAVLDGKVVANSDLGVPRDADEAHQWGTLVHPEHRGHRLGAALKVANLKALMERQPEVARVVTTNAETNAWMVAINDRLGFRPVAMVPSFKRLL
ncbi:MAG: GNAT family N-acetyltransferase [Nocardioides sp.]